MLKFFFIVMFASWGTMTILRVGVLRINKLFVYVSTSWLIQERDYVIRFCLHNFWPLYFYCAHLPRRWNVDRLLVTQFPYKIVSKPVSSSRGSNMSVVFDLLDVHFLARWIDLFYAFCVQFEVTLTRVIFMSSSGSMTGSVYKLRRWDIQLLSVRTLHGL